MYEVYKYYFQAHINVSSKDWIALIPKGWTGVDEQVAFQAVINNSDVANLAIKSIVMENDCFRNIIECEKQYQLMYIGQYLEVRFNYIFKMHYRYLFQININRYQAEVNILYFFINLVPAIVFLLQKLKTKKNAFYL